MQRSLRTDGRTGKIVFFFAVAASVGSVDALD